MELGWLKSVRAIAVVIIVLTMAIGLFSSKIDQEKFMQVAMLIVGAYFAKRDTASDRGK